MALRETTVGELKPGDRKFIGVGLGGATVDRIMWETPNAPEVRIMWESAYDNRIVRRDYLPTEKVYVYPPYRVKYAKYLVAGDRVIPDRFEPNKVKLIKAVYQCEDGKIGIKYAGFFAQFSAPELFDPDEEVDIQTEEE